MAAADRLQFISAVGLKTGIGKCTEAVLGESCDYCFCLVSCLHDLLDLDLGLYEGQTATAHSGLPTSGSQSINQFQSTSMYELYVYNKLCISDYEACFEKSKLQICLVMHTA